MTLREPKDCEADELCRWEVLKPSNGGYTPVSIIANTNEDEKPLSCHFDENTDSLNQTPLLFYSLEPEKDDIDDLVEEID